MKTIFILAFFISLIQFGNSQNFRNEKMPEFNGGDNGLVEFIRTNLHYPVYARDNCITGKEYAWFIITPEGKVDSVRIMGGIHESLDQEAMRVVKLTSGHWNPGKRNDTAIAVQYRLPFNFQLVNTGCHDRDYYYKEGLKFLHKEKFDKALLSFDEAIKKDTFFVDALYNSAMINIKLKNFQTACNYLNRVKFAGKKEVDELIKKYCSQ
jgi:tetratricopeptide (TPR) repeat protein